MSSEEINVDQPCARINFNNESIQFATLRDIYTRRNIESLIIIHKGPDNQNITCNFKQFSQYDQVRQGFAYLAQEEKASRREANSKTSQLDTNPDQVLESQVSENQSNVSDSKMDFNLKDAKSVIGEFNGYKNDVVDYVEAITYYNDSLKREERSKLIEFICKISLKGKAKDAITRQLKI